MTMNCCKGASIKDVRKISAKIDHASPLSAFVRIGPTPPPSPCGRPHLTIGAEETEHDHSVMPVRGYLIQVKNDNVDQK